MAFWLQVALSLAVALGGAWLCLRRLYQARHLLDTPTSKIRSAAQGYVELYGVLQAQPDSPMVAPLSGKPCLWWRFRIEEHRTEKSRSTWSTLERGVSESCLLLDDGTGHCLIDPRGAEVHPSIREVWSGNTRHPRGVAPTGLLAWISSAKLYRYTEERLHADQPLYAIGDFHSGGGGRQGLDLNAAQTAVIREWKSDFAGLLSRFDSDGNGQLDEQEWNRVRLAARLEAEDRHRQLSTQPAQHRMLKPREAQPFILSNGGEDELARRFYWQAAGYALVCLGGAVVTALLLGIARV